jgi:Acetyltransferase (GNAT) domain
MRQTLDPYTLGPSNETKVRSTVPIEEPEHSSRMGKGEALRYLSEEERQLWDELVEASPQGSLFCRSWWLKVTGPGTHILGYFDRGRLIAGIPLFFKRRFGVQLCTMPKLTQTWGVVVEPVEGKRVHQISRQMEILTIFARHLAAQPVFLQRFHPEVFNFLPFQWQGFQQISRVTYVIEHLCDLGRVWADMRENQRREIRKAEKRGIIVEPCDPQVVADNVAKTYGRQGLACPTETHLLRRIHYAARQNGAGDCFAARDVDGRVHAAAMLVWDRKRAYYLTGGGDPALRTSGAASLLLWKMMQFASARSAVFDFEGSQIPAVERFFRAFGASQVWYHEISKMPRWLRAGLVLAGKA